MPSILGLALLGLGLALSPSAAQPPAPATELYTTTVTISTYPYANFLQRRQSDTYNMDYHWLNWSAYYASDPHGSDRDYTLLVLENPWLRLGVMPELGGRLYGVTVKATGEELLYQNPVLKPTHWGPPEQGWWLAAGGIEWGLPVEEHGYEWGVPWSYTHSTTPDGSTVTLRDTTATDRVRARIRVELPADQAAFRITPRLENPTAAPVTLRFWDNAMLAPGASNTVGPDLHFVVPIPQVTVHSRGDGYLPAPGEPMNWPVHAGTDYSRLGNWNRWLGFFARPQAAHDWAGVYDRTAQRGVARVFPHLMAPGVKGFGVGWTDPIDWRLWTDIRSYYVELHGGPSPTFWDSITLQPGAALEWTETWLPLQGLPALSLATEELALGVSTAGGDLKLGFLLAAQRTDIHARLWRKDGCALLWQVEGLTPSPGKATTHQVQGLGLAPQELVLGIFEGSTLLAATRDLVCPPPASHVLPLSTVQTSTQFGVSWAGQDAGRGLSGYDVQVRDGDASSPWTGWLHNTLATSAVFVGQGGHTYAFRTRARDAFGNQEGWPLGAWQDAFTTVLLGAAPVLITSEKVADVSYVQPGEVTAFQVRLRNTGNLSATVVLSDPLPVGLSLTHGPWISPTSAPDPIVVGRTILWNGTLGYTPGGAQVTIGFAARVPDLPSRGAITNTVWIGDGVHPRIRRWATLHVGYWLHLPVIFRKSSS
jgi:uncharacterized repeat protein (TIGR01451 family)